MEVCGEHEVVWRRYETPKKTKVTLELTDNQIEKIKHMLGE